MTNSSTYKQIFDQLYSTSSEADKALFDNPHTREEAPVLYTAWNNYQTHLDKNKSSKPEAKARDPFAGTSIEDFCFGLEILGAVLAVHNLEKDGLSRGEAIKAVARSCPPGAFYTGKKVRKPKPSR